MKRKSNVWLGVWIVTMVAVMGMVIWGVLNRQWIYDWWRGMGYEPSGEMARILDELELTERGEFLFKASMPVLSSSEKFNAVCREGRDEEMAVLGCYTGGDIYVYDVQSEELRGIRELTTAHELLHAVWARMGEGERESLKRDLTKVMEQNRDFLEEEVNNYGADEREEELYVRAGTEVKDLPGELEKHYGEIFRDQDLVVSYYDSYITVFREIEAEMEVLKGEMNELQTAIGVRTEEYEARMGQLNAEINSFNACAETVGCFGTEAEFYAWRGRLVAERDALAVMYDEINGLVEQYNTKVEQYNADVTQTKKLNRAMNSSEQVKGL